MPLTRKQRLAKRRALVRLIHRASGIEAKRIHSDVGFMFNRAGVDQVEAAIRAALKDPDPIAGALEILAAGA